MTSKEGGDDPPRVTADRAGTADSEGSTPPGDPARQWLLVAVVVLATLVVPAVIYWRPPALPFRIAFLVLPLVPALLLGGAAVYVAVTSRRARESAAPDRGKAQEAEGGERDTGGRRPAADDREE